MHSLPGSTKTVEAVYRLVLRTDQLFVFQKLEYTLNTSNDFVQSGISPEQIERDLKQRLQISKPTENDALHGWINVS